MDFEGDFVLIGNELEDHVELGFLEALGDEATDELLELGGIFVCGFFAINEIV